MYDAGVRRRVRNSTGTRNIDFDAMEVENASKTTDLGYARRMRRDWLSFLNQGLQVGKAGARHPVWATGVSDSHRMIVELPGYARTFVGAGEFPAKTLDIKAFNQQVLAGNMTVTAGPYITVTATKDTTSAGVGQTLAATGAVTLNIKVQASPWVPVDEVRIIKNGCTVQCFNGTTTPAVAPRPADPYEQSAANVVRFDATLPDTVSADSYYVVEAGPSSPDRYGTHGRSGGRLGGAAQLPLGIHQPDPRRCERRRLHRHCPPGWRR